MNRISLVRSLLLVLALTLLAACAGGSTPSVTAPLSDGDLNLIFVASPDLVYSAPGDINPSTANLTNQGLQRSLLMATYLKQHVLGTKNVTGIYALEPMTHLQTAYRYPDIAAMGYIQQFALLNQFALPSVGPFSPLYTDNSYPLNVSYASGTVPIGAATPLPALPCPGCQGLEFNDTKGNNVALVTGIVNAGVPGFYVFSAPWATIRALMADFVKIEGYRLKLPAAYRGPNYVCAIAIAPTGVARLVTYNSHLNPPSTYPELPSLVVSAPCTAQSPFSITVTAGSAGAKIPAGINTNETIYMIRHAEAHPTRGWENGNFVAAGQWRALGLPNALRGKISPTVVYSIDPAQIIPSFGSPSSKYRWSYVRPSMTVEPYAIANNLPYYLVSEFEIFDPTSAKLSVAYFFNGDAFSNQTVLLAWEHNHLPPLVNELLSSYFPGNNGPTAPAWPDDDYDTIWTVKLDDKGNLTIDNALCEGIDSTTLPVTAPQF
jgi:hypothetical protein